MLFSKKNNDSISEKEHWEMVDNVVREEYTKKIIEMIKEEIKNPGTYDTKISIKFVGNEAKDFVSTEEDIATQINSYVYHRGQIITVTSGGTNGTLGILNRVLTIVYWEIEDFNNIIYKNIRNELYLSNPYITE